jgi:putative IMPACT (imprinted ancient) family translation regulator
VGGLIHAYRSASAYALARARIVEKELMQLYQVVVSFPAMPLLMRLIKETSGRVVKQEFQATHAKVQAEIPLRHSDHWQQSLQVLQATQPGMVVSERVLPGT